jgi:hypothetical protein
MCLQNNFNFALYLEKNIEFADFDLNKLYAYADYHDWTFAEQVELIKGRFL